MADRETRRLAVLVSGSGTNLQAIIDATADGRLPAQVVLVASNKRKAFGLERARRAGIPTMVMGLKKFLAAGHTREEYDAELARRVAEVRPDLVVLAGWMLILSPAFLERFPRRVMNLHPALPGQFPGMHGIQRAHEAYLRGEIEHTGVMVHWVIPEVDAGAPLATAEVPIYPEDSLEDLEQRVHRTEHRLLVQAIAGALEDLGQR
jgi:formyltetrahydrofolate-dependent phosphoribosylglycinamide formyltransferase